MSTPTAREMADAMIRGDYYRVDTASGTVALWPVRNQRPQIVRNAPADRRAVLRSVTKLRRPPYSEELWREVVSMLPDVTDDGLGLI